MISLCGNNSLANQRWHPHIKSEDTPGTLMPDDEKDAKLMPATAASVG